MRRLGAFALLGEDPLALAAEARNLTFLLIDRANQIARQDGLVEVLRFHDDPGMVAPDLLAHRCFADPALVADHVAVSYSLDSGRTFENVIVEDAPAPCRKTRKTIEEGVADPEIDVCVKFGGDITWTVPEVDSTSVRVKVVVRDAAGQAIATDFSNADLTISAN